MKRKIRRKIKRFVYFLIIFFFVISISLFTKNQLENFKNFKFPFSDKETEDTILGSYIQKFDLSKLQTKLKKSGFIINRMEEEDSKVTVFVNDGPLVVFSKNKDIDWQVESLLNITTRLTIERRKPAKIDFSFNKTIVNF